MKKPYHYLELTMDELDQLERSRTIFLMSLGPIEAHGPHLPLGADILLGQKVQEQHLEIIQSDFPTYQPVIMPTLPLGADALPKLGSLGVSAPILRRTLLNWGRGLAKMGFKYLLLADNHGGPRHLLACEIAARQLYRKYNFYLLNPFSREFSMMMADDPRLLQQSGLQPGQCGDIADLHGGTNETSLFLAAKPEQVRDIYRELPPNSAPPPGKLFVLLAALFRILGQKSLGREIENLGQTALWAQDPDAPSYVGCPARAQAEAGIAMLEARKTVARSIIETALKGEKVSLRPPLWPLRILSRLP